MEHTIFAFILLILIVLIIADDIRTKLDFKRLQHEINEYIKVTDEVTDEVINEVIDEIIKFQTRLFDKKLHEGRKDKFEKKEN